MIAPQVSSEFINANSLLTLRLSLNNYDGIFEQLKKHPQWPVIEPIFIKLLSYDDSDKEEKFKHDQTKILLMLEKVGMSISMQEIEDLKNEIKLRQDQYYAKKVERSSDPKSQPRGHFDGDYVDVIAFIKAITNRMYISGPETWSTSFERRSYALATPVNGPYDMGKVISFRKAQSKSNRCRNIFSSSKAVQLPAGYGY